MPFYCQKKFHLPPSQTLLAHMFSRDRNKNVFGGRGVGGDWSDSYISRMQGHPHHLGISWRLLQPPVKPSQGSIEIQGETHGQEQAGLVQREEKETSGREVRILRPSTIRAYFTNLFSLIYHSSPPPNPITTACTPSTLLVPSSFQLLCHCSFSYLCP